MHQRVPKATSRSTGPRTLSWAAGALVPLWLASAAAALPGDSNHDGRVSPADLTALERILDDSTALPNEEADADQDGFITSRDLAATIAIAFGEVVAAPTPLATPTATASAPPSPTPTATRTASPAPTPTATASATVGASPAPSPTQSSTPTLMPPSPTPTGTHTPSATASTIPTPTPTLTATRTSSPSATPIHTATTTPVTTPGDSGVARSVAGGVVSVANGMAAIPSVVTALVSGLKFASAAALGAAASDGGAAGTCPLGGTATRSCQSTTTLVITLKDGCEVATSTGSVTLEGTITLTGSGFCPLVLPPWNAVVDVVAKFKDAGTTRLTTGANLTARIDPDLGGDCKATGATLNMLHGTLHTEFAAGATVMVEFNGTDLVVTVSAFIPQQCVPVNYSLTFDGPATVTTSPGGAGGSAAASQPLLVSLDAFTLTQDSSKDPTETLMKGSIASTCFGGTVSLETPPASPLMQVVGEPCPSGGDITITAPPGQPSIHYLASQMVEVGDLTFPSCLAQELQACTVPSAPTATSTASATRSVAATPPPSATSTATPSRTPAAGESPAPTATPSKTPSGTPSSVISSTPTTSPAPTSLHAPTLSPTATATLSPSPTATTTLFQGTYCDTLSTPAFIPDDNVSGINNTITIADTATIADLNVRLDVAHTFVGDLKVNLTHVDTGTQLLLINRPGRPASQFGCSGDDISCVLDDAGGRAVHDVCAPSSALSATIAGRVKPESLLSVFNGESIAGMWRLNVSDNDPQVTGSLLGWCLQLNAAPPTDPVVTSFTCNGDTSCTLTTNQPFALSFSYTAPGGNADGWRIIVRRDDGITFDAGQGVIAPPNAGGTIQVSSGGFTCSGGGCPENTYEYALIVTDSSGEESDPVNVEVRLLATP